MSHFVPSNSHINAIVLSLVEHDIIDKKDALRMMAEMRSESYSFVSQYYRDGLVPQSLNDHEYPFSLDYSFDLSPEQIAGMIQSYRDNSSQNDKIEARLDALLDAVDVRDVENFDLSNGAQHEFGN